MGIWLRSDSRFRDFLSERYRQVVDEAFWEAPTLYAFSYITIILGCCMIIVAFLGCCGVNAENRALLIVYAMAVFLLLIDVELSDALNYMVQHYYQGAGIIQESLDRLQTTFRCCGNAGCSDFRAFRQDPPRSCDIRCDGCHYRIWVALKIGFSITLVVFFIVVICQVLALVFALYIVFIRPEQVHMLFWLRMYSSVSKVYVDRERDSKSEPRRLVTETLQKHNVPCNLKKAGHGRN
uniref:Tetraspanin n=1 Tax=Angiostrongylus cantonensis TaxID=6313 RepID=A0A0K0D581_ANGCA